MALAALFHAGIIATGPFFPELSALGAPASTAAPTKLYEVETLVEPAALAEQGPPESPQDAREGAPPEPRQNAKVAPSKGASGVGTVLPGPSAPALEGADPAAGEGPASVESVDRAADEYGPVEGAGSVLGVPGLGGAKVWSIEGVLGAAPAAAPAKPAAPLPEVPKDIASRVLSGTLRARDQELGLSLPSGGLVANAIVDAVRASDIPGDAKATFEVKLGPDGNVLGVRVASASAGDGTSWDRIAKSAAGALASKALAMRGSAADKGATVTVTIDSKVVYPAGTKDMVDVQPVCAEEQLMELAESLSEAAGGDHGPIRDPAVSGAAGKGPSDHSDRVFCIPIGLAARGDLSNLGARPTRVVHSHYDVKVDGEKALIDPKLVDTRAPWLPANPDKIKVPRKWKKKPKKGQGSKR